MFWKIKSKSGTVGEMYCVTHALLRKSTVADLLYLYISKPFSEHMQESSKLRRNFQLYLVEGSGSVLLKVWYTAPLECQ